MNFNFCSHGRKTVKIQPSFTEVMILGRNGFKTPTSLKNKNAYSLKNRSNPSKANPQETSKKEDYETIQTDRYCKANQKQPSEDVFLINIMDKPKHDKLSQQNPQSSKVIADVPIQYVNVVSLKKKASSVKSDSQKSGRLRSTTTNSWSSDGEIQAPQKNVDESSQSSSFKSPSNRKNQPPITEKLTRQKKRCSSVVTDGMFKMQHNNVNDNSPSLKNLPFKQSAAKLPKKQESQSIHLSVFALNGFDNQSYIHSFKSKCTKRNPFNEMKIRSALSIADSQTDSDQYSNVLYDSRRSKCPTTMAFKTHLL